MGSLVREVVLDLRVFRDLVEFLEQLEVMDPRYRMCLCVNRVLLLFSQGLIRKCYLSFDIFEIKFREPLDQLVLLDPRDPQACRVCPEKEEPVASQELRETE